MAKRLTFKATFQDGHLSFRTTKLSDTSIVINLRLGANVFVMWPYVTQADNITTNNISFFRVKLHIEAHTCDKSRKVTI